MKKTINEYRSSMDRIIPSESFISDTEALMKKLRDEHLNAKTQDISVHSETIPLIDLAGKEAKRRRIKRAAAGFSAAAAVLVAVFSLNVYRKVNIPNVDTSVTEKTVIEKPDDTIDETSFAETEPDSIITTAESSADDNIKEELFSETTAPDSSEALQEAAENDNGYKDADPRTADENKPSDEKRTEKGHEGVNSVNSVQGIEDTAQTDAENNTDAVTGSGESSEFITSAGYNYSGYGSYEIPEEETEYDYSGIPVYVPGFDNSEFEEDYSYEYDDTTEDPESAYIYENSSPEVYSLTFSYDIGNGDIEAADKVYVPDSIFALDSGEYFLVITPGFDNYDPVTGMISVPEELHINEDDTENIALVMDTVMSAASGSDASYYDSEQRLSDYRYSVTVYSADESEDHAMLFDISFNSDCLVINRYDNGTVSSVEYSISSYEYENSDKAINQLYD